LTDELGVIKEKFARVPTDVGRGKSVPQEGGVAALLSLVELFQGEDKRKEYETEYLSEGVQYKSLKEELAQAIFEELKPIQARRKELDQKPKYVDRVIGGGAEKARKIARETLDETKRKMGLI